MTDPLLATAPAKDREPTCAAPAARGVGHPPFEIEVFYDGACPLCRREVALLRRLDRHKRIVTTDIASVAFQPTDLGKTYEQLMARIHGRLPDGTLVEGVEVFRRLYGAIGLPWLAALTRKPLISRALDSAYAAFARNRLRLTGRCDAKGCAAKPGGGTISAPVRR